MFPQLDNNQRSTK